MAEHMQLLTIPDVAAALKVHRSQVYDLIAAGKLAVVDVGTGRAPRSRVRADELERFIHSRTRTAA